MKKFIMALVFIAKKLWKTLPEIVAEVEKAAADGVIKSSERKAIVMKAVKVIAKEFGVELSWIHRLIVSKVVDKLAKKLPSKDIIVPAIVAEVLKVKKTNKRKKK